MDQFYTALITGFGAIITGYILNNTVLKEGLTDIILSKFNKTSIDKIDLKYHKVYIALKNYKNQITFSLVGGELKNKFCREYIGIIFNNMLKYLERIDSKYKELELDKTKPNIKLIMLGSYVNQELEECKSNIVKELQLMFKIPTKIESQFDAWRIAQMNALKLDIENVTEDDNLKDLYTKSNEYFNKILSFFNYVVVNYTLLFNAINGAFNELKESDVFLNKSDSLLNK